jgi:hypothetical protein
MSQEHLNLLRQRIEGVLSFLQANAAECFLPAAAYVAAAEGEAGAAAAAAAAPPPGVGGGGGQ